MNIRKDATPPAEEETEPLKVQNPLPNILPEGDAAPPPSEDQPLADQEDEDGIPLMPADDPEPEAEIEDEVATLSSMSLEEVLKLLVPPEDPVLITDEWSREYRVKTRISARKQIAVMRALRRMLEDAIESGGIDKAEEQIANILQAGPEALISALVPLLTDEESLVRFEAAFKKAQPRLFKQALKGLTEEDREDMTLDDEARPAPGDLFPVEEMIRALYPSLLRPLHTILSIALRAMGRAE